MSRGLNRAQILGYMGADPECRTTGAGAMVTNLRVATTESWKDKQTGEKRENTEWHRVALFGRLAEVAGQYTQKGTQVFIEGSLRTTKYTDKDRIERYSTEIVASDLQIISNGRFEDRADETGAPQRGGYDRPAPREQARGNGRPQGNGNSYGAQRQAPAPHAYESADRGYVPAGGGADFGPDPSSPDVPF